MLAAVCAAKTTGPQATAFLAAAMSRLASSTTLLSTEQLLYCLRGIAEWPRGSFADAKLDGDLKVQRDGAVSLSPQASGMQRQAVAGEAQEVAATATTEAVTAVAATEVATPIAATGAATAVAATEAAATAAAVAADGPGSATAVAATGPATGRGARGQGAAAAKEMLTLGQLRERLLEQLGRECVGRKVLLTEQQISAAAAAIEAAGLEGIAEKIKGSKSQIAAGAAGDVAEGQKATDSRVLDDGEMSSWGAAFAPL